MLGDGPGHIGKIFAGNPEGSRQGKYILVGVKITYIEITLAPAADMNSSAKGDQTNAVIAADPGGRFTNGICQGFDSKTNAPA